MSFENVDGRTTDADGRRINSCIYYKLTYEPTIEFKPFFVCVEVYVSINTFSVMSGRSYRFLGIANTFGE